jgi:hypothetical protein
MIPHSGSLARFPCVAFACICALGGALLLSGCISNRFRSAPKNTPPPTMLNVVFAPSRLEATLATVITYNGPGSWKRDAFWDEYVVSIRNPGAEPLKVSAASIVDMFGSTWTPGDNPWALEKQSKNLERKYIDAGVAFVRYTAPGLVILGSGAVAVASAGAMTAAAGGLAVATLVALPIYYLTVLDINALNKSAMESEFSRRKIALPLVLAPGEKVTGSFFFPMLASPRSLSIRWAGGAESGDAVLALDALHDLHVKKPTSKTPVP